MVDPDQSSESSGTHDTEVTEKELEKEITKILKNANLKDTTTKKVIQQLEKTFGTDLSAKKKLIDKLVMDYVENMESSEDEKFSEDEEMADDASDNSEDNYKASKPKRGAKKTDDKKKKAPAKKGKKGGGVTKKGGKGSGYTRAIKLSPELSELVGATELPRHEVVKRVWAIIKERQLLDPNNKQFAICDKPLYKVIGTQRFYTFGMMKYLKHHFIDG